HLSRFTVYGLRFTAFLLACAKRLTESGERGTLPFGLALLDELREVCRRQNVEGDAVLNFVVCLPDEVIEVCPLSVVEPDFGDAQRGVDGKLVKRLVRRVSLDDDIGRRVYAEGYRALADQ